MPEMILQSEDNEVAKQLVIKMRAAELADKTVVNYFQVVKAVVAAAVSSEGEQLYPRNWNFHFIGLPVIDEKKQCKPSLTVTEVDQILTGAKGRYKVLLALLAGTGLRIGEALGLKLGEHLSGDFSTIRVRQSVWRSTVQAPKTDNAIREVDIPTSLAEFLKAYVGGRTSGFLFHSESGRPLAQRNILWSVARNSIPSGVSELHTFERTECRGTCKSCGSVTLTRMSLIGMRSS